ncbi:MAG: bifunctional metallophosphatase/5'-nucleotidase [Lachnospiraceae bacterium]|nr:bifunctional metallophosphatase/5'-nucleotidase [Lachnospiraceae bacterium]
MKKISALVLCFIMSFGLLGSFVMAGEPETSVDIMFVHDTHSHLNPFATVEDGKTQVLGGFAKLKTLIKEQKALNPDTLLLDAGDFSMGTLIQAVYEEEASEIRMLGELGIDVSTLGNHEFDYKASGIANMMNNAVASGDPIPAMVMCNVDWESMEEKGLTKDQEMLKAAFEKIGMKDYVMVEKNGVKIAVTGMIGIDSIACIPNPPLEFKDPVEAVKATVAHIKEKEEADMIVCISHGGTWEDPEKSEDEILAKAVPELDVIISGHTHTKLDEAIVHGSTYIVSVGEYGKYLGSLSLVKNREGRWDLMNYEPITVGEEVLADPETQAKVNALMDMVDSKYLEQFGLTKDEVLCENDVEFCPQSDLSEKHTELNLGSIIADSYTYAAEQLLGEGTVAVSVAPAGTIRDSYPLGNITTETVFNSFSLGIGEDGIPGYPLIGVYLTGAELKTVAEIDSTVSDLMTTARLYTDGLYWHYNPNRMLLNKATDVFLVNGDEVREELVDDQLYLVVTDFYSSQMLGNVTNMSYGLLSIVPKFADGTVIENYEDAVLKDAEGNELKAWTAIANYMKSMEDTDGNGIPNMDKKYAKEEGRKVIEDSKNIGDLIKNPNKFFFIIIGLVILIIAIFVGIILLVRKVIRKIRKRK